MANRNLEHAQKLYQQILLGEIPPGQMHDHINLIYKKLQDAFTVKSGVKPDLSSIDIGVLANFSANYVQHILDQAKADSEKRIAVVSLRDKLNSMARMGMSVYEPDPEACTRSFYITLFI